MNDEQTIDHLADTILDQFFQFLATVPTKVKCQPHSDEISPVEIIDFTCAAFALLLPHWSSYHSDIGFAFNARIAEGTQFIYRKTLGDYSNCHAISTRMNQILLEREGENTLNKRNAVLFHIASVAYSRPGEDSCAMDIAIKELNAFCHRHLAAICALA